MTVRREASASAGHAAIQRSRADGHGARSHLSTGVGAPRLGRRVAPARVSSAGAKLTDRILESPAVGDRGAFGVAPRDVAGDVATDQASNDDPLR
jgi:hypothetical protein